MFCQARPRSRSLTTWQAIARPNAVHPTSVRWSKKTLTACQKALRTPRVRQGSAGARRARVRAGWTTIGGVTSHGVDDYLETIYFLAFPIGEYKPPTTGSPTLASRVAEMLGVSRASAGEMLKRLEADGLVERGEHKEAILTEAGRERAEQVVRKHRIIERMLTDFMGYTAAEAHVHADELGGTFSDDMVDRISEKLGHPDRCPHGWPVDHRRRAGREPRAPAAGRRSRRASTRRSCASPSTTATCCTGSTTKGSSPAPSSRYARSSRPQVSSASPSAAASRRSARRPRPACSCGRLNFPGTARKTVPGTLVPGTGRYAGAGSRSPSPAASRSAAALSVRSHVKSWSSRPKCP